MTIREQATKILTGAGWVRDPQARSLTKHVFVHRGRAGRWYLGSGGSIRFGHNAEGSVSYDLAALRIFVAPKAHTGSHEGDL